MTIAAFRRASLLCAASTLWLAGAAAAQSTGSTSQSAAQSTQPTEVVVTARRVAEALSRTPVAVTAISKNVLQRQHIDSTTDLQTLSPSLSTQASLFRTATAFAMRGQESATAGVQPGVQTYLDEVAVTPPTYDVYDLDSVQVLKGPQGTLFGRNNTGGAVLFTTRAPQNTFGGYADVSYGNLDYQRYQGALNVPLIDDKLLVRVAGNVIRRDGFTRDIFTGQELDSEHSDAARVTVLFKPTTNISDQLTYDFSQNDASGSSEVLEGLNPSYASYAAEFAAFGLGPFYPNLPAYLALQQKLGPRYSLQGVVGDSKDQQQTVINSTTVGLGQITFKNIVSYTKIHQDEAYDPDGTPYPIVDIPNTIWPITDLHTITEEPQLHGTFFDDRLRFIAGAYYQNDKSDGPAGTTATTFGDTPLGQTQGEISLENNTSQALFSQADFKILPNLTFTGGYRYTWDNQNLAINVLDSTVGSPCPGANGPIPLTHCTSKTGGFVPYSANFAGDSYNLTLDWQATRDTLLYIASRHGYRTGGFNALAVTGVNPEFQPEYLTDYEIGLKQEFHAGDVRGWVNLAAYTGNYTNFQRGITGTVGNTLISATINAKSARISGFEAEALVALPYGFQLSGFWSYTDAQYLNFIDTFTTPPSNLAGQSFAGTPMNKASVTVTYEFPVHWDHGGLSAQAIVYNQSKMALVDGQIGEPFAFASGYTTLNFNVNATGLFGRPIDLSFFLKNATNTTYIIGQGLIIPSIPTATAIYGEPRTYGVELRYSFGGESSR
jgi:iron complex outermembrane recepter protein